MRYIFVLLGLIISFAQAAPKNAMAQRDADAKALTALIKKNLPSGWVVVYQPPFAIEIKRMKPTAMNSIAMPSMSAPNPPLKPEKPGPLPQYKYFLRIEKFRTVADYRKIKAVNTKTQNEMTRLAAGLIWGKGHYVSRNEKEAQRVRRYEKLEKSLYELPDYYWRQISLSKLDMMRVPEYDLVIDDKVRAECKRVTLKVLDLLTPYEKASLPSAEANN